MDVAGPLLLSSLIELEKIEEQGDLRVQAPAVAGQCWVYLGSLRHAERAFRFVLSHQPEQIDAHRGLAVIYFDQEAYQRAIPHLEKAAELDATAGRPHLLLGRIHKDNRQYDLAIDHYRQALLRHLPGENLEQHPARVGKELAECPVRRTDFASAWEILESLEPLPEDLPLVEALGVNARQALGDRKRQESFLSEL
jgi:tetratricopeptide (TPR) repeat protein